MDKAMNHIDKLIQELQDLAQTISTARQRKAGIVAALEPGRYPGSGLDIMVYHPTTKFGYSAKLLAKYVPAETLERCKVQKKVPQRARIVNKLKGRVTK